MPRMRARNAFVVDEVEVADEDEDVRPPAAPRALAARVFPAEP